MNANYRHSVRVSISPDRRHLICNNLRNGVDRYSISDSNWLMTHGTNDVSQQARGGSRLYGVAFLDCKVVVCGNNGSKLVLIYDTNRPGPNCYVFRNFQLDPVDRCKILFIPSFAYFSQWYSLFQLLKPSYVIPFIWTIHPNIPHNFRLLARSGIHRWL